jgi:hypothetical protein
MFVPIQLSILFSSWTNKFRKKYEKKNVSDLRHNKLVSFGEAGMYVCRCGGRGIGYGT